GGSQWVPVSQILGNLGVQAPQPQQPVQPAAPQPAAPQNYGQAAAVQGSAAPAYAPLSYGMDYATWATRVLGYLIGSLLVQAAMAVLYLAAGALTAVVGLGSKDLAGGMCCIFLGIFPVAALLVGLYNRVYLVSVRGYSVGQGVVKVKVVDANGNLLSRN